MLFKVFKSPELPLGLSVHLSLNVLVNFLLMVRLGRVSRLWVLFVGRESNRFFLEADIVVVCTVIYGVELLLTVVTLHPLIASSVGVELPKHTLKVMIKSYLDLH